MKIKLSIGDIAEIEKFFSEEEVILYAKISNDSNPIHFDINYASQTSFKKPIVHGLLVASLFGGLLGTHLPGKGTIHLGQDLKFLAPVYVGEKVKAIIKIINIRKDKPIITFSSNCIKENGETAITGKSVVYYKGPFFG